MFKIQIRTDNGWIDVNLGYPYYWYADAVNAARVKSEQTKRPTRIRKEV